MNYVEFFEKDAVENICACLTMPPKQVILVGDNMKLMRKYADRYKAILAARGFSVKFVCKTVNKNNIQNIVDTLSRIIETYEDCVFDLTGGEDLYLVAMGIVYERYREKNIQMHRFNLRNNTIADCDQDGYVCFEGAVPELTVEENIRIYGGDVVYDEVKSDGTHRWVWTEEFRDDIDAMWEICKQDVRLWNTQIGVLAAAEALGDPAQSGLTTTVAVSGLRTRLEGAGGKYIFTDSILKGLYCAGLLTACKRDEQTFSVTYKNEQVKKCLTKAGQALEMKIFSAALQAKETDGTSAYSDVMNGVYIDWDGDVHTEQDGYDTENEIDVMMMRGMVPVFVSCKNGTIDMNELYKLAAVAGRFGGKYAKKVLVATALSPRGAFAQCLRQRAKDMNIRLVEGIQKLNDAELQRVVRSFWRN